MALDDWKEIPSSLMKYEEEVERYVLEPLLRFAGIEPAGRIQRRFHIDDKIADYAVIVDGDVSCIVEAKRRIAIPRSNSWADCADLAQASWYASRFHVPFILIDCDRVFCFDDRAQAPRTSLERRSFEPGSLKALRTHILGDDES